jgi:ribosome biogenesis GTPase
MSREFDYEEAFHNRDRKQWRKERKLAQEGDRSKFKKTDQEKKEPVPIDPSWLKGRVVAITGEGIWVDAGKGRFLASLKGLLKKERLEVKNILAVGDLVYYTEDLAIAHVSDRYSHLSRIDISGKKEQLIAVNIDQAVIAVSCVNPPLKPALIDRYLIAAEKGNIHPIIAINKIDLLEEDEEEKERYEAVLSAYEKLGIPVLSLSIKTGVGLDALKALLKGKTSVFTGQSGVGKSSLINACFGLELKTGELATKTAKGSHTTTTAELLPLPEGGYCVDTPGIRSFAIWKLQREEVKDHFREFAGIRCRYPDCQHINEPDCGVLKALEKGKISPLRYESYLSLLSEALGEMDNRGKRKYESD